MLEVYVDPYAIEASADSIISNEKDFVSQWHKIIDWTNTPTRHKISLRPLPLVVYLENLKDVFGNNIQIIQMSPRKMWEKSYNIKLSSDILDAEIANLINRGCSLNNKETYLAETLLFLSGETSLPAADIEKKLINLILKGTEVRYSTALIQAIKELKTIQSSGKRELWQFILDSDNKKSTLEKMIITSIAKWYPQDSPVYADHFLQSYYYKTLDFDNAVVYYLPHTFKKKVKDYLSQFKDLEIVDVISGRLEEEWVVVLSLLKVNPIQETHVINSLLTKAQYFDSIKNEIYRFLPVAPPKIISFDTDGSIFDWLKDYFDYYKYTRLIQRPELTETHALRFGDFFYNSYLKNDEWLLRNSILSINELLDHYIKIKRSILLLVIDGLGYEYANDLQDIFSVKTDLLFSTPPTKTTENKQRILSGLMDKNVSYTTIINEKYNDILWEESDSKSCSLSEFLKKTLDLYVYWENQFDVLIHADMNYGKRFNDHISLLRRSKEELDNFTNEGGVVVITGDHGFTILPDKKDNCISLPEDTPESHRRIAYYDNALKDKIGTNVYIYDKLALAKGYTYFNTFPRGGTHGGLSPEEAVVPLIVIDKTSVISLIPLEFTLLEKPYFRRQIIQTSLIIYNPNPFDLKIDGIDIIPKICSILEPLPLFYPKTECPINIELNLVDVNQANIILSIKYRVKEKEYNTQISIKTSGAMIEKDFSWD